MISQGRRNEDALPKRISASPRGDLVCLPERVDGVLQLRCVGKVGHSGLAALLANLRLTLEQNEPVVCDLSGVVADAGMLRVLPVLPRALARAGGWPHSVLHVVAEDELVLEYLRRTGLQEWLPVYDSLNQGRAEAKVQQEMHCSQQVFANVEALRSGGRAYMESLAVGTEVRSDVISRGEALMGMLVSEEVTSSLPLQLSVGVSRSRVLLALTGYLLRQGGVLGSRAEMEKTQLGVKWGAWKVSGGISTVWMSVDETGMDFSTRMHVRVPQPRDQREAAQGM